MWIEIKLKVLEAVIWFLIRLEEGLTDILSPYLEPEEIEQSRESIARHKQEMEE